MSAEVKQLVEFATQDLVAEIVEKECLSISKAMEQLFHSSFFQQLTNPDFGLYRESGAYLYEAYKLSKANNDIDSPAKAAAKVD